MVTLKRDLFSRLDLLNKIEGTALITGELRLLWSYITVKNV